MDFILRQMAQRPVVLISLTFIVGILLENILKFPLLLCVCILGFLSVCTLIAFCRRLITTLLMVLSMGMVRTAIHNHLDPDKIGPDSFSENQRYILSGQVMKSGTTRRGNPKFTLDLIAVNDSLPAKGKMIVYAKHFIQFNLGDTITAVIEVRRPSLPRNPHEFNYRKYMEGMDIYWEGLISDESVINIKPYHHVRLPIEIEKFRKNIIRYFQHNLTSDAAGIISALILGAREGVKPGIREDFSNTGVIHVLAVSGLHVGYVSLILMLIFGFLRFTYRFRIFAAILGLVVYAFLTGLAPSVMRASIMASLYLLGTVMERRSDVYNVLGTSALILLLIDPSELFSIGFQLSFIAVISIVTFYPRFQALLMNNHNASWLRHGLVKAISGLFLVSLAAQIGTLPLSVFYFQKIPIIGLMANLVVVPAVGLIVALGFALLLLGSWIPFIAAWWSALLITVIELMSSFVHWTGTFSFAYIKTRSITSVETVAIMIGIFLLILIPKRKIVYVILVGLLAWLNVQLYKALYRGTPSLEVVILDVGQGDAILLHTPQDKTVVVDTGANFSGKNMGRDVVAPYLNWRGWDTIDLLVLTHPHNDHIGGAEYLIRHFSVGEIWDPDVDYDSYGYERMKWTADSIGIYRRTVYSGYVDSSMAPMYLRVLGPPAWISSRCPSNINNVSIVVQLFYGKNTMLLTGDAEVEMEKLQVSYGELLNSDILKVPHHGSKTSSSAEYIDLVDPGYAIISLGKKNKFKHPSPATVRRYLDKGILLYRTDEMGAQWFRGNGINWKNMNWKQDLTM